VYLAELNGCRLACAAPVRVWQVRDDDGTIVPYRNWNPFGSFLAAAVMGGLDEVPMAPGDRVLVYGDTSRPGTVETITHVANVVGLVRGKRGALQVHTRRLERGLEMLSVVVEVSCPRCPPPPPSTLAGGASVCCPQTSRRQCPGPGRRYPSAPQCGAPTHPITKVQQLSVGASGRQLLGVCRSICSHCLTAPAALQVGRPWVALSTLY
jgi:hypothetical protein